MWHRLVEHVQLAVRNLSANLLRSLLTLLGLIIGVGSVIFMMSVTAGAQHEILREMEQLGLRNIILNSVEPPGEEDAVGRPSFIKQYGLLDQDIERIRQTCQGIEFVTAAYEVREDIWVGSRRITARLLAVEPEYFTALRLQTTQGRRITDLDSQGRLTVCNVGTQLLDRYHIFQDPMTVRFEVRDLFFNVVGILDVPDYTGHTRKVLATSSRLLNVYVPAGTALERFGTTHIYSEEGSRGGVTVEVDQAIVRVKPGRSVLTAADLIRRILESNHPRRDYELIVPLELLQQKERAQRVFSITMILIASISLLVGGIGIINIMLATVTERTREIGIRRACGAKRRDISFQFLIETTTLSVLGGLIGALVGISAVYLVTPRIGWTAIVTPVSLALALGISCLVGIIFGTYPAIKASRLNPIQALRFE